MRLPHLMSLVHCRYPHDVGRLLFHQYHPEYQLASTRPALLHSALFHYKGVMAGGDEHGSPRGPGGFGLPTTVGPLLWVA